MPNKCKGFTLVEIIIVMTLLGIVSAYASFKFPGRTLFNLDSNTQNLILDIRLAKTLSMSLNSNYRIVFTSANTYQIQDENNNPYFNPSANSSTTTLDAGISLSPLTTIAFNFLGQPMNASNVLLTSQISLSITDGQTTHLIFVDPKTGYVHE